MNAIPHTGHWQLEIDASGIAWLALDQRDTSTNVLSRAVMAEFDVLLASLEATKPRGLVLYSGKSGGFVAGADVREFPSIRTEQEAFELASRGQAVLARLEAMPCPSVAAIHGAALGGGLELALAATWRIGIDAPEGSLGLPEIQLGLHPGFGGTVRATRLVGVRRAMDLMLTGRTITFTEGRAWGLLDALATPDNWRDEARRQLGAPVPTRTAPLLDRLLGTELLRGRVADSLAERARRKADPRHYPAPSALIELWREHGGRGAAAYTAEARSLGRLAATPTSHNLVRVFFLRERLKHLAERPAKPAAHVHVVGAGVMGGDIAAWCAARGLTVTLQDRELKYIEPALARATRLFSKKFTDLALRSQAAARLTADVEGAGAARADVVIEAIFENLEAKQKLLRSLELQLKPDCLLATNTSSIPLESLMTCLQNPGRLVGLHFFNPVAKLPLVEVVETAANEAATIAACLAFARQIGKLPVPCRSHPGFLVNRILAPYLAEALCLVQEGVPPSDIDAAATDFGMPMGPIELADTIGLDIALHVARIMAPLLHRNVSPELEALVAAGKLGRKAGQGFYVYQEGRPVRPATAPGPVAAEVQDRLILALLNEAAHCLHEGIVADADLIDAGVIFGTGFAPFRGGPLHYAREAGVTTITAKLSDLAARLGPRFAPSPGWDELKTM